MGLFKKEKRPDPHEGRPVPVGEIIGIPVYNRDELARFLGIKRKEEQKPEKGENEAQNQ